MSPSRRLARFPLASLRPRLAALRGHIFENRQARIPLTLFHDITVPLEPFSDRGELVETEMQLNFIQFGVHRLAEMQERTFRFPSNPKPGYVDGSVYLRNAHVPVDVPRIALGRWTTSATTRVSLDLRIAFEYEATGFRDTPAHIECELKYAGVALAPWLASTPEQATRVAQRFLDLNAYLSPVREHHYFVFPPRLTRS